MRNSLKATVALITTLGVSAALAYDKGAQGKANKEAREQASRDAQDDDEGQNCAPTPYVMQTYDANRDGKLDSKELKQLHEVHRAEMVLKFDKDKDGRLNASEKEAFEKDKKRERFARVDANGDGKILREEAEKACGPVKRFFTHLDTDGNGQITPEEFANAKPPAQKRRSQSGP